MINNNTGKLNVELGKIKSYDSNRGFGFLTSTFDSSLQKDIFFHISMIKKYSPGLAKALHDGSYSTEDYLWYAYKNTQKGISAHVILTPTTIQRKTPPNYHMLAQKIENLWVDINRTNPSWLHDASIAIFGFSKTKQYLHQRNHRIEEFELERAKRDALLQEELKKQLEQKKLEQDMRDKEFNMLVDEIQEKNFTYSNQVSQYIIANQLGFRYKHISGIVTMEQNGTKWNYEGGFPPSIYAKLCRELSLRDRGSKARAIKFTSFNEMTI